MRSVPSPVLCALLTVACAPSGSTDDPDGVSPCDVLPKDPWDASTWEAHAAVALRLRAQLDTLSATMADAEKELTTVTDVAALETLLDAGDPSLASVVSPAYRPVVDSAFDEFLGVLTAGPADLVDDDGAFVPGEAGGIFGASRRGVHEGGVEVRQLVDKGLFGGAGHYRWAVSLTEAEITPATIDAIAAAFGGDPAWNTSNGTLADSAKYAAALLLLDPVVEALVAARAQAADPSCAAERDSSVVAAFRAWEESLLARHVNYAHTAAVGMASAASGTLDDDVAEAIHVLSEGIGLAAGFLGLDDPSSGPLAAEGARRVSDAEILAALAPLRVDPRDLGAADLGALVVDPSALAGAADTVEAEVAEVYGWDADTRAALREVAPD